MGKRPRRFAWLRHWSWATRMLIRLIVFAGVLLMAVQYYHWIGPPFEAEFVGENQADLLEARRAAFSELGRLLKAGLLILGAIGVIVLLSAYWSRRPVMPIRAPREERVRKKAVPREKPEDDSGESDVSHNTIFIDPETLEDHRAGE